jgi:CubicO group peptidase (beta-lactamase class C family)
MFRKVLGILALCMLVTCVSIPDQKSQESEARNLESLVKVGMQYAERASEPIAGLSLAVYFKGEPLLVKGYGFADLDKKVPVDTQTVFRVGSITKQFTAAAIMLLVEDKKLMVSDKVRSLLPDYPELSPDITIEQLLSHRSGIANYTELPDWEELENEPMIRTEFVRHFLRQSLDFKPGQGWNYSNSGYYLLGLVIEKISGKSYRDFLSERLISKAGLKNTAYCNSAMDRPQDAQGYRGFFDSTWEKSKPIQIEHPFAAGGLCSTAEDLALWALALSRGAIISQESLQWMQMPMPRENQAATDKVQVSRAGFIVYSEMSHRYIGAGGSIEGFISSLDTYPDDELIVVSLGNTESYTQALIGINIARSLLGPIKDEVIPEESGKSFAGKYQNERIGLTVNLSWDRGQLFASNQEAGQKQKPSRRLLSQGNGWYLALEDAELFRFEEMDGKVTAVFSLMLGGENRLARVTEGML